MNNYETAHEGMRTLVTLSAPQLKLFTRSTYSEAFRKFYEAHIPAFDALAQLYGSVMEPDSLLENMSQALVEEAASQLAQPDKRKNKALRQMDLNMQLAVYIYPAILRYEGEFSQPLVETIGRAWKETFPESNVITPATVDNIEAGFKKRFCYITTAVCETLGRPDDCYELSLLRSYRDGYLSSLEEGEQLIDTYYDVAPSIVKHIGQQDDSGRIYEEIYEDYIRPCITLIENGDNEGCKDLYIKMVEELKERYFYVPSC